MSNPWDNDPVVSSAATATALAPWEKDAVLAPAPAPAPRAAAPSPAPWERDAIVTPAAPAAPQPPAAPVYDAATNLPADGSLIGNTVRQTGSDLANAGGAIKAQAQKLAAAAGQQYVQQNAVTPEEFAARQYQPPTSLLDEWGGGSFAAMPATPEQKAQATDAAQVTRDAAANREAAALEKINAPVVRAAAPAVLPVGATLAAGATGAPMLAPVVGGTIANAEAFDATDRELRAKGVPPEQARQSAGLAAAGAGAAAGAAAGMAPKPGTGPIARAVFSGAVGGSQDLAAQLSTELASGKPIDWKQVGSSAAFGVVFDAGMQALHQVYRGRTVPTEQVQQLQKAKTPQDVEQVVVDARQSTDPIVEPAPAGEPVNQLPPEAARDPIITPAPPPEGAPSEAAETRVGQEIRRPEEQAVGPAGSNRPGGAGGVDRTQEIRGEENGGAVQGRQEEGQAEVQRQSEPPQPVAQPDVRRADELTPPREQPVDAKTVFETFKKLHGSYYDADEADIMAHPQWKLEQVPLSDVSYDRNEVRSPEEAQYFAQRDTQAPPIILRGDRTVLDGMHRIAAAEIRGDKSILAYVPDTTVQEPPAQATPAVPEKPAGANAESTPPPAPVEPPGRQSLRTKLQDRVDAGQQVTTAQLKRFEGEPWADEVLAQRTPRKPTSPDALSVRRGELQNQLRDLVVKERGPDISELSSDHPLAMQVMRGEQTPGKLISLDTAIAEAEKLPDDHPARVVLHNLRELEKNPRGTKVQSVNTNDVQDGTRVVVNDGETFTIDKENGMVEDGVRGQIPEGGMTLLGKKVLPPAEHPQASEPFLSPEQTKPATEDLRLAKPAKPGPLTAQRQYDLAAMLDRLEASAGGGKRTRGVRDYVFGTTYTGEGLASALGVNTDAIPPLLEAGAIVRGEGGYRLNRDAFPAEAPTPTAEPSKTFYESAGPGAAETGIFGQPVISSSGIGEQSPMFHEPNAAPPVPRETVGSAEANKPENTVEMFPGGPKRSPVPEAQQPEPAAPEPTPAEPIANDPRAKAFRKLADGLTKQIEDKRRDMTQNPTPKRMREYRQRRTEGDQLERVQKALNALADARESGTLPAVLESVRSKSDVAKLVAKKMAHSGGYYDAYYETPDYQDNSATGKALQGLIEQSTPEQAKAQADREKRQRIEDAEGKLRFQKIEGFFPTPRPVIDRMVQAADVQPGQKVLEPSAGKGDIADELRARGANVDTVEIYHPLRDILKAKEHNVVGDDFLQHTGQYDRIVMNPPFERGQDIEHVQHAYEQLKPGGKLVALMSEGSFSRSDRKATEFRQWLNERDGTSEQLASAFAGKDAFRQTGAASRMVVVSKPSATGAVSAAAEPKIGDTVTALSRGGQPVSGVVKYLAGRFAQVDQGDGMKILVRRDTMKPFGPPNEGPSIGPGETLLGGTLIPTSTKAVNSKAADAGPAPVATSGGVGQALRDRFQSLADSARRISGQTLPSLSRQSPEAAQHLARHVAARVYAQEAGPIIAREIVGAEPGGELDTRIGAMLAEENLMDIPGHTASLIGAEGSPIQTHADLVQTARDPRTQEVLDRYNDWFQREAEPNFKASQGIAPTEDLPTRGSLTGTRVNLKPILADESPSPTTVYAGGQGNLNNPRLRPSPFARKAKGTGDAYDISLSAMIENTIAKGTAIADLHRAYDSMVKDGLAVVGKPGQRPVLNGKPTKPLEIQSALRFANRNAEGDVSTFTRPANTLYVRSDVYPEVRQALGVDQPLRIPIVTSTANVANKVALAGTTEALYHVRNQVSALVRSPGAGFVVDRMVRKAGQLVNDDPEVRQQIVRLAREGAWRAPGEPLKGWQRFNPLAGLSKLVEKTDRVARLVMDDAYTNLVNRGLVKDTPEGRRDWVNQLGQYQRRLQEPFVAAARDTGIAPFATAGTNFWAMRLRNLVLDPRAPATSPVANLKLRTMMLGRLAVIPAAAAAVNYLRWGKMQPGGVPIGAIKTGEDERGRSRYVDPMDWTGERGGLRASGIGAVAQGVREGRTAGQTTDQAVTDVATSALSPFEGPIVQNAAVGLTGKSPAGFQVAKRAGRGESQAAENVKAMARTANPIGAALTSEEPGSSIGGPFRVKTGQSESAATREARRLAAERSQGIQLTDEERQRHDSRRQLVKSIRENPQQTGKLLQEAVAAGHIPPSERAEVVRESHRTDLENLVHGMEAEDAMRVFGVATPEERKALAPLLREKIMRNRTARPEQHQTWLKAVNQAA